MRYLDRSPGRIATTANEIHIPVGRPVRFELVAGDVIHSFWIPKLAGKTDLIPGQTNVTGSRPTAPASIAASAREYCGAQHAKMALAVVAEPPGSSHRGSTLSAQPAAAPADSDAAAGAAVFASSACAACHTVRGTPAGGRVGPDLTHLASRQHDRGGHAAEHPGQPRRLDRRSAGDQAGDADAA